MTVPRPEQVEPENEIDRRKRIRYNLQVVLKDASKEERDAYIQSEMVSPTAEKDDGGMTGALRSIGQGVSFNLGDEIEAGVRSIIPGNTYRGEKDKIDANLSAFRTANPGKAFTLEMGGGLLSGGAIAKAAGGGLKGAKALARLAGSGAASGAVAGAGASEGSLKDRAVGGALGSMFGAGLGAVASRAIPKLAATKVGGRVGNVLSQPVGNVAGAARGAITGTTAPSSSLESPDEIVAIAKRLANRGNQTVDDIRAGAQNFADVPESRIVDIAGEEGKRHARGIRTLGGEGAQTINQALDAGHAAQRGSIESTMGGRANTVRLAEDLLARQRLNAQPLYQSAFSDRNPIDDEVIGEILSRPDMQKMIDNYAKLEAIAGRKVPKIYPSTADADLERAALQAGDDVGPVRPRSRSGGLKDLRKATDDELAAEYKYNVDANATGEQIAPLWDEARQDAYVGNAVNRGGKAKGRDAARDEMAAGSGAGGADRSASGQHTGDSAMAEEAANARNLTIAKLEAEMARRKLDPAEMYSRADRVGDTSFDPSDFGSAEARTPGDTPTGKPKFAPTIEGLDHAKKALDAEIENAFASQFPKDHARGFALSTARAQLLKRLDELGAGGRQSAVTYAKARQTWGGDQASKTALSDGAAIMKRSGRFTDPDAIAARVAEMSPADRELAQAGAAREIGLHLNGASDSADLTKRLANDDFRERVTALWGDKAPQMLAKLDKLRTKADVRDFIKGNSQTMDKAADAADAAGENFIDNVVGGGSWSGSALKAVRDKAVRPVMAKFGAQERAAQAGVYAEPVTNQKALGALMREMERQRLLKNPSAVARGQAGRFAGSLIGRN